MFYLHTVTFVVLDVYSSFFTQLLRIRKFFCICNIQGSVLLALRGRGGSEGGILITVIITIGPLPPATPRPPSRRMSQILTAITLEGHGHKDEGIIFVITTITTTSRAYHKTLSRHCPRGSWIMNTRVLSVSIISTSTT